MTSGCYASELPSTAELVIVGGGIVGAATAFRAGLHPLLLERRPRLCTLTTAAATGAFRLQFDNREEVELIRESVELFLHFEDIASQSTFRSGVQQQDYLWLTTTEEGVAHQQRLVSLQHGWGQTDIELLVGNEVRRRFPYVSSEILQARFRAEDGFLDQKQVTMGLVAASGAAVVTDCGVTGFDVRGGRLCGVRTVRHDQHRARSHRCGSLFRRRGWLGRSIATGRVGGSPENDTSASAGCPAKRAHDHR